MPGLWGSVPGLEAGWPELERRSRVRGRRQTLTYLGEKNRHYGCSDGSFSSEPGSEQTQRARPLVWVRLLLSRSPHPSLQKLRQSQWLSFLFFPQSLRPEEKDRSSPETGSMGSSP